MSKTDKAIFLAIAKNLVYLACKGAKPLDSSTATQKSHLYGIGFFSVTAKAKRIIRMKRTKKIMLRLSESEYQKSAKTAKCQ